MGVCERGKEQETHERRSRRRRKEGEGKSKRHAVRHRDRETGDIARDIDKSEKAREIHTEKLQPHSET